MWVVSRCIALLLYCIVELPYRAAGKFLVTKARNLWSVFSGRPELCRSAGRTLVMRWLPVVEVPLRVVSM